MLLSLKREMSCKDCNEKVSAVSELPVKWYLFIDMYTNALMAIQEKSLEEIIKIYYKLYYLVLFICICIDSSIVYNF